jgi:hypothetical protein
MSDRLTTVTLPVTWTTSADGDATLEIGRLTVGVVFHVRTRDHGVQWAARGQDLLLLNHRSQHATLEAAQEALEADVRALAEPEVIAPRQCVWLKNTVCGPDCKGQAYCPHPAMKGL